MGLNIGIRVKRQEEGYMSYGYNPKGTREELEAELWEELAAKFPKATEQFSPSITITDKMYDFDVRFVHYASGFIEAGYGEDDMYLALLAFALPRFGADYGIDIHVYHSP